MKSWAEGNKDEAVSCLDEAIGEESDSLSKVVLLLLRAQFHCSFRNHRAAIDDYTAVIGLSGAPVELLAMALVNRAIAYGETGETQRRIDDCTAVTELPGAPVDQVAKALVNRAIAYGETGETQRRIDDCTAVIELSGAPVDQVAEALLYRGITYGETGEMQRRIDDCTAVTELLGAPTFEVGMALLYRAMAYGVAGKTQRAIDDCSAVIGLAGVGVEPVAMARLFRGMVYSKAGAKQCEIDDYAAVIGLPDAPVDLVAGALYLRGLRSIKNNDNKDSQKDFDTLIHLANAPATTVIDAYLALSELHWGDGRWSEGFEALEAGMECGAKAEPPYFDTANRLIGVVFSAGLIPEARIARVTDLLALYKKHQALSVLGEGIVKHIGSVFRAGEPFPSADNLDQWASAWEQAAASVDEFRLSLRLLRTGVDFVKAGGKDPGILLSLTAAERQILKQALGLAEKNPDEPR